MRFQYALALTCETFSAGQVTDFDRLRQALRNLAGGIDALDLFMPHPEFTKLPLFDDGAPPAAIVEFSAAADRLRSLAATGDFATAFQAAMGGGAWRAGLFRVYQERIAGAVAPRPRQATTSLIVRYYPPVQDAKQFADHYVTHHPPLLARFPRIRGVLCHVPTGEAVAGLDADETVIRNEVIFDSMEDLAAALRSPALAEVRADSAKFPAFGRSTHHAMLRERL